MSQQKIRRIVLTGVVAAITITGVWYGAGMKIKRDFSHAVEKVHEATPDEMIAQFEQMRMSLATKQMLIQMKIDELERRKSGMSREESMQGRERRRNW